MRKEDVIRRAHDKINLVRRFQSEPATQETAWNQAIGYLQAMIDMDVISFDEYLALDRELEKAFLGRVE